MTHVIHHEPSGFLCPECGSREAGIVELVEPGLDADDPRSGVLRWITCADCGFEIPAHIGELRDGVSPEEARREWLEVYRRR